MWIEILRFKQAKKLSLSTYFIMYSVLSLQNIQNSNYMFKVKYELHKRAIEKFKLQGKQVWPHSMF